MLLPQLREVFDEGHKTLVFSQFTSMLAIVSQRLDEEGIPYAYLDGRTRDRQARAVVPDRPGLQGVPDQPEGRRPRPEPDGGGLHLPARPLVEPRGGSQAIDRAHRIGQTRPVFAYRLIARDTVEEKVLELQRSKKQLADAIITADNSLIRTLRREELELLLS